MKDLCLWTAELPLTEAHKQWMRMVSSTEGHNPTVAYGSTTLGRSFVDR